DRDAVRPDDRLGDRAVHALREPPLEPRDHVATTSALVGVRVVAPSSIVGEEPAEPAEVLCRKRGSEPLRDLLRRPNAERQARTAARSGVARCDPDTRLDRASAPRAEELHGTTARSPRADRRLRLRPCLSPTRRLPGRATGRGRGSGSRTPTRG